MWQVKTARNFQMWQVYQLWHLIFQVTEGNLLPGATLEVIEHFLRYTLLKSNISDQLKMQWALSLESDSLLQHPHQLAGSLL